VNYVRAALTVIYCWVVVMFFFACFLGYVDTSNIGNEILYVGGLIMLGIILTMAALTTDNSGQGS